MKYEYFNPNPRGKITGDCVKRAIVVATGKDYLEVEKEINRTKKNKQLSYNCKENWAPYVESLGGVPINMQVPKGTKRWHVADIDTVMPDDISYILQVSKHLIGIKNNTIYDLFDDRERDKGIYKIWVFGATPTQISKIQARVSKGNRFTL